MPWLSSAIREALIRIVVCTFALVLQAPAVAFINSVTNVQSFMDPYRRQVLMLSFENSAIDVLVNKQQDNYELVFANTDAKSFSTLISKTLLNKHSANSVINEINWQQRNDSLVMRLTTSQTVTLTQQVRANQLQLTLENAELTATEDLVSLSFQSVDIRQALQLLAEHQGFNLLLADEVSGELSVHLEDVPWQQAVDAVLQLKQLGKQMQGNLMLVAPLESLASSRQQEFEQQAQLELSQPLTTELIQLHYAKASEVAQMLDSKDGVNMLSERGAVTVDERTNSLLIRELPRNMSILRQLIEQLDIPVKQVQIEARIVTMDEGDIDELGVRWGVLHNQGSAAVGGSIEANLWQSGLYGESELPIEDYLNVNLGLANPNASTIAFQVAKLGSDLLLDLELSALQAESKAEIISSPKIITTNKKAAYIEQGTEIPYLEAASSGATSVSFRKAVLSLEVVPQITPDNRLVLDLNVTQDRPGEVVKTGFGEAVAINTQRIGTQVSVNNGETIVLGGIYQQSSLSSIDKVPGLGDLPLLGNLFRRSSTKQGKSELLIFVTPTVIPN